MVSAGYNKIADHAVEAENLIRAQFMKLDAPAVSRYERAWEILGSLVPLESGRNLLLMSEMDSNEQAPQTMV